MLCSYTKGLLGMTLRNNSHGRKGEKTGLVRGRSWAVMQFWRKCSQRDREFWRLRGTLSGWERASPLSSHRDESLTLTGPRRDTTLALLSRGRPQRAPTPEDWRPAAVPGLWWQAPHSWRGSQWAIHPRVPHLGAKEHKLHLSANCDLQSVPWVPSSSYWQVSWL